MGCFMPQQQLNVHQLLGCTVHQVRALVQQLPAVSYLIYIAISRYIRFEALGQ